MEKTEQTRKKPPAGKVVFGIVIDEELRERIRDEARRERMLIKDWIPLFFDRHLGQDSHATKAHSV